MQNIHIKRLPQHPTAQGCIEPEDRKWQLLIDAEGFPHLYVQVNVEMEDGQIRHGYFAVEHMLPEGTTIPDLMKGSFGGFPTPEEICAAEEAMKSDPVPCPLL